jgi:copper(I)-binding protein
MRFLINFLAAGALALSLATPVLAQTVTAGSIAIEQPWARATPPGAQVGGGYMTITNTGGESDTLVGGSSPVAGEVQVHEMSMQDGVMKMRELPDGLQIKAGETVTLKPGGYHLMLMNLKEPLKQGEQVSATLEFAKAGKVEVMLNVESIGAKEADDMSGMDVGNGSTDQ